VTRGYTCGMGDEEWAERFREAGLTGWSIRQAMARTTIHCGSFSAAGEMAARIARLCDEQDHPADIDIRAPDMVQLASWTQDDGGLTDRDLRLALAVDRMLTS
jgi:pterin-4a-carbinolamine dehydratase